MTSVGVYDGFLPKRIRVEDIEIVSSCVIPEQTSENLRLFSDYEICVCWLTDEFFLKQTNTVSVKSDVWLTVHHNLV